MRAGHVCCQVERVGPPASLSSGASDMTTICADLVDRFVELSWFAANVLVAVSAAYTYKGTHKRSLLLIAISASIGAFLIAVPWFREDKASWTYWGFYTVARLCDLWLWVVGAWFLFRDYSALIAQQNASDAASQRHRNVGM